MRTSSIAFLLMIFGSSFAAGCQQSNSISGTVTYNGEPVESGSVAFTSSDGSGPGFGAEIVNGKYETNKLRLGQHAVFVRGREKAPLVSKDEFLKQREHHHNPGLPVDYIPESAEGNGQTVDIEGGSQTMDFALNGPPRSGQPTR